MKRVLPLALCGTFLAVAVLALATRPAMALKQFKEQFEAKYVIADSQDPTQKAFAEAVAEAKCNVCHEGKSKKNRNVYGTALSVLLDKKEDKENVEKIQGALATVGAMKSDPTDENSPTFEDLINEGKLPAGEPK